MAVTLCLHSQTCFFRTSMATDIHNNKEFFVYYTYSQTQLYFI